MATVVKGKLITCKREVKEFKGKELKEKLYITLAEVKLNDEKMKEINEAFKDSGKSFTPDWVKNFKGYVNLSTEFKIPARQTLNTDYDTETDSIEDFIKDSKFPWMGAEVKVALNIKEGAIYPISLIFISEGEAFDPFAAFADDEED